MNRTPLFRPLLLSLLLALVGTTLPSAPAPGQAMAQVEPALSARFAAAGRSDFLVRFSEQADLSPAYAMGWEERGRFVFTALQETAARSQAQAVAYLDGQELAYRTFIAGNELYVWAGDREAAQTLASLPGVAAVLAPRTSYVDPPLAAAAPAAPETLDWGIADTKADQFWTTWGLQGEGIIVASIGTGVLWTHPALDQAYRCAGDPDHAACWYDPTGACPTAPCDNNGQGTHTTGTMVGDDDPALPHQVGMAPGATWIACKACDSGGSCSQLNLNACADWLLAPGGDPGNRPHVVNNSWGGAGGNDWYLTKVQAWTAAGIFPTFPVGNGGPTCGTIGSPSDYQVSFATAAHDASRTIASFSSRGPSAAFGHEPYTKPNISAPGVNITSSDMYGGFASWSGSGMAAPHSAGAVALLWSCAPWMIGQVPQTFELLQDYANTPPAGNCDAPPDGEGNYTYGYGFLDVLAAGAAVCQQAGRLEGYVYDLDGGPIPWATVTAQPGGQTATADADGYYSMLLPAWTYTATAAAAGYGSQTLSGIVIQPGQTTLQNFTLLPGEWIVMPPTPFEYTRFDCAWFDDGTGSAYIYNRKVYCMGGRTGSSTEDPTIWRYDPVDNAWAAVTSMVEDVSNYTANILHDENSTYWGPAIYVVGGYDADGVGPTNLVQRYYPTLNWVDTVTSDPWPGVLNGTTIGAMGCAAVLGKLYCFGGWENVTAPYFSGETWEYDPARPATQRWRRITTANLNPPRAYPLVAVQDNVIYAIGGNYQYNGGDLVPTDVVEALDVNNLAAGWVPLPSMPVALGEGRGFGMDIDTRLNSPWGGWIYTAGGGDWPDSSAEALAYDTGAGNWYQAFPDLNYARRDHAGVFIPLCTPDPNDPMPSLMVIGGRMSSDTPPFAVPEYFPLGWPCPQEPPACQTFPAGRVAWTDPSGLPGDDPLRGGWASTDFQVLNLAPDDQPFLARFVHPSGETYYSLPGSLAGGETQVHEPGPALPWNFSGTLVLSTPVRAAMAVVHLEPPPEDGGNTIFPGVPDDIAGHSGYTPIDGCTRLYVHNMDSHYGTPLRVYLLDAYGAQVAYDTYTIPPLGTATVDPGAEHNLPADFLGSVILDADLPIRVTANSHCGGYAAFSVSPYCSNALYAPYLPPRESGWMTTTLVIQNPTGQYVYSTITYGDGSTQTAFLPPWNTRALLSTQGAGGWAKIDTAGGPPLVAVVRIESRNPAARGPDAYRALALEEAGPAVALPALFNGFQGWHTADRIRVMNLGDAPTRVTIRYSNTADDSPVWDRQVVGPGEVGQFMLPPLPSERAAAILVADPPQPIVAVAGASYGNPELRDGQISYAGTNFPFNYVPVNGASFTAAVAGSVVTCDGAVLMGDPPIDYTWDWGDGARGVGQHTAHMYGAAGDYTVVMTATNVLGFYSSSHSQTVTVTEGPAHSIYLPVVMRGFHP